MIKKILPLLLLISNITFAQDVRIELDLDAAANKEVFLAHYYISNIYVDDTVKLDANGYGILTRDSILPQGLYKIYMDDKNHFDFLLGADQTFKLTNNTFDSQNIKIEGATETDEFVKYVVFLKGMQKRSAEIREQLKTAKGAESQKLKDEMSALNPKMKDYWNSVAAKYPNTFLAKFLLSNHVPALDISTLPKSIQENDSLLLRARFDYQKVHFWDNFDYKDERFLYTPLLKPKLETWFTKALYQNYDSLKDDVFRFIEDVRPKKRIFQYVTSFFLNASVNSNIMGMTTARAMLLGSRRICRVSL